MRANLLIAGLVLLALYPAAGAQPPGKPPKPKDLGPVDEEREILKELKEAYKAPYEVHQDVLSELRKQYRQPTPERESKIIKELRRLYLLTPEQEDGLIRAARKLCEKPSPEQEEWFFRSLDDAERLPNGMVPPTVQEAQARKIFQRLDLNGDGRLTGGEVPEPLRREQARWDGNRDGAIDAGEYWSYYQGRLGRLSDLVVAGEIDLFPNRARPAPPPPEEDEPRPAVFRVGKLPEGLPDWFARLDTDRDAQVGLYEWRKGGRPLREFFALDRNGDGFVTVDEVLRSLPPKPAAPAPATSGPR